MIVCVCISVVSETVARRERRAFRLKALYEPNEKLSAIAQKNLIIPTLAQKKKKKSAIAQKEKGVS